jgi:hypothetical protein
MIDKEKTMSTVTQAKLTMVRQTKGAVLYNNVKEGEGESVTNLYLRKSGLGSNIPGEIEVTIIRLDDEAEED